MNKTSISLCMIVKNEEKYLEKCLKSVEGIVDEVIVVDTGSSDATVEIALRNNAKVVSFPWIDDFAAARNFSVDHASSDYILVLDADEYLEPGIELQKDLELQRDYYYTWIKNYGQDGEITHHRNIRLFRRESGLRYHGKLHENLNTDDSTAILTSAEAGFAIYHVGYMPEVVEEKSKQERNHRIMLKELERNPSGYNLFNMGIVYASMKEYGKALEAFKKAYPLVSDKTIVKHLIVTTSKCLRALNRYEEGVKLLTDATNLFPDFTDFYYNLGLIYEEMNYLPDAEWAYLKCIELGDTTDAVTLAGIGGYLSYYRLTEIYDKLGRCADAFDCSFKVLLEKRQHQAALYIYLKSMLRVNISQEETLSHLNRLYPAQMVDEVKLLIKVLYDMRHPLLGKFLSGEQVRADLRAVALQYSKNYTQAMHEWEKVEDIPLDNAQDIVLISFILKDESLLNKIRESVNASDREWKYLKKVILHQDIDLIISPFLEKMLLTLCESIMVLEEFESFEYLSKLIMSCSIETQYELANLLYKSGFMEAATDLLLHQFEKKGSHGNSLLLLGDICLDQGHYDDAASLYDQARKTNQQYRSYERMIHLYEVTENVPEQLKWGREMQMKFPSSTFLSKKIFA